MTNSIKHVMENDVPALDCDDTIAEAVRIMTAAGRSALPVLNPDFTPFGMLNQQELLRFHLDGGNSKAVHAWEICMTRPPTLGPDSSIREALHILAQHDLRELVVVDRKGRFAGIATREHLLELYISDVDGIGAIPEPGSGGSTDSESANLRESQGV